MSHPGYALKIARICAGEVGENTTSGPVSVYAFGADDPGSMLEARMSLCRERFGSLIGEPFELERPLRFFVFGKRSAFDAFFKWAFLYGSNLDGFYVPWSTPTIAITTDSPAYRLVDPERIVDSLIGCFYLDGYRKTPAPSWVQMGIANVVACGGDRMELARLNRKMLAALSRGTLLGVGDLFERQPKILDHLAEGLARLQEFQPVYAARDPVLVGRGVPLLRAEPAGALSGFSQGTGHESFHGESL